MKNRLTNAFTLLELLLVIAIIASLTGLIIFSLRPAKVLDDTKSVQKNSDIENIQKGIEAYISERLEVPEELDGIQTGVYDICQYDNSDCTSNSINLDFLVNTGFLSEIPVNPDCLSPNDTCYDLKYDAQYSDFIVLDPTESVPGTLSYMLVGEDFERMSDFEVSSSGILSILGEYRYNPIDFDPTEGVDLYHAPDTSLNIFHTKLNASTQEYLGTHKYESEEYLGVKGLNLAINSNNDVYIVSEFEGTMDFDPSTQEDNHTVADDSAVFLNKTNSDGSYGYTYTGIAQSDNLYTKAEVNDTGIYIGGNFTGTKNFNLAGGTDNKSSLGSRSAFLSKYSDDNTYEYTYTIGGVGATVGYNPFIAISPEGDQYIAGRFDGTIDFDNGITNDTQTAADYESIFLTKINSDGSYGFTKTFGIDDWGWLDVHALGVNPVNGDVYIGGYHNEQVDFDPGPGEDIRTPSSIDAFLSRYSEDGTYINTYSIGSNDCVEELKGLGFDTTGNLYLLGFFGRYCGLQPTDLDPTEGIDEFTQGNYGEVSGSSFISKYTVDGNYVGSYASGNLQYNLSKIFIDSNNSIYLGGTWSAWEGEPVDLNITEEEYLIDGVDSNNGYFIAKYTSLF